jgi:hypothetical protein
MFFFMFLLGLWKNWIVSDQRGGPCMDRCLPPIKHYYYQVVNYRIRQAFALYE